VDFAYEIHTDVGHHCVQARVNGRIVPLKYQLRNGEIVEIVTDKNRNPSRDWLAFVKTAKARNKIRQWLNKHERLQAIELGRKMLEKEAQRFKISLKNVLGHENFTQRLEDAGQHKEEDLFAQIGFGKMSARSFLENLLETTVEAPEEKTSVASLKQKVKDALHIGSGKFEVSGLSNILISRAKCCSPIPGEEIVGYISRGRGIIVHTKSCSNIDMLLNNPEKRIEVSWGKQSKEETYPITLLIYTEDRKGMIADISNKITKMDVNIRDFRAHATSKHEGVFQVALDIRDLDHLAKIVRTIKSIKNVRDVERYEKTRP
jgi:guanosine-3',5'-bis(diphosphate) 3'-pyrophosphohydrolase